MKVQPRQQLIEIWRATARSSFQKGSWVWGGRDGSNSISDAEHLLCLMNPATEVPTFRLDDPDQMADDVAVALRPLGDSLEIPRQLVDVLTEYLVKYSDESGAPTFSGGSYFQAIEPDRTIDAAQQSLDVVDSFAISVTLSLATIGFVRSFSGVVRRPDLRENLDTLERLASTRLTAAMIGLLRSFTVSVFDADSDMGRVLIRTTNQSSQPDRLAVRELRTELRDVHAGLRDEVIIGYGAGQGTALDNPNRLFECGWSWGIVKDTPEVVGFDEIGPQRDGVAETAPYLYFTVVALEAIEALFSRRTRALRLLSEDQLRLAQALQLRWDLTQKYWSTLAQFGDGTWPLEDLPWRTTDGFEDDYLSLLVTSIMVQDLVSRRATDESLSRVGRVLAELAGRNRITRRSFAGDSAIGSHSPGFSIEMVGSEDGDGRPLRWVMTDFAPLLLQRTIRIAGLLRDPRLRRELIGLADEVWEHIARRRLAEGTGRDLWDEPANVFLQLAAKHELPSWYYTKRVVDCLVGAAAVIGGPPVSGPFLVSYAADLLSEAQHLFDQELLDGSSESGPAISGQMATLREKLARAERIQRGRPGSAAVLASEVLSVLDNLAAARDDVNGGGR